MTRYATLEETSNNTTRLIFIDEKLRRLNGTIEHATFQHISQLWEIGQRYGITHFWIMPGTFIEELAYDFFTEMPGWNIFVPLAHDEHRAEFPRGGRCWKEEGHGFQIFVFFPHREPWSWTIENPTEVLTSLDYLTKTLDLPVQWSPQAIGSALLRGRYSRTHRLKKLLDAPKTDLSLLPFRHADKDIQWVGHLRANMVGGYLHIFDKNSAHPSGASSMVTGCNEPIHVEGHLEPNSPGIYRITWESNGSIFDGAQLPKILDAGQEWVTQPVLKYALLKGYHVKIHEAYIFPNRYRIFHEWVSDLWQAREFLKDASSFQYDTGRNIARDTVKRIMNSTISSLRVNWWADMLGMSKVAVLANLAAFVEMGATPILVFHDAICFVSQEINPSLAIRGILDRSNMLGGYKHVYTLKFTQELYDNVFPLHQAQSMMKQFHKQAYALGLKEK